MVCDLEIVGYGKICDSQENCNYEGIIAWELTMKKFIHFPSCSNYVDEKDRESCSTTM